MDKVYLTRQFDHSPEVIFRALTTPGFIVQWFGPPNTKTHKATVDLWPGGRYVFELTPTSEQGVSFTIEGEYRETNAPFVLTFTLNYVGLPNPVGESLVSIRLSPITKNRTELLLKQEFSETPANIETRTQAWEAMLDRMDQLAA